MVENDCSFAESLIDKVLKLWKVTSKDLQDLLAKGFENLEINAHSIKGPVVSLGPVNLWMCLTCWSVRLRKRTARPVDSFKKCC